MNFLEYQSFLNDQWKKLDKRILEEEQEKKAKVKIRISDEFLITLNTSGLPGLFIEVNNTKKVDRDNIPNCKGWNIEVIGSQIVMSLKKKEYNEFFRDITNLILTKIYLNKLHKEESINFFFLKIFCLQKIFLMVKSYQNLYHLKKKRVFLENS